MGSEEDLIEDLFIGLAAIKSIVFDLETLRRNIPEDEFIDSQLFAISTLAKSRMARFENDLLLFVEMQTESNKSVDDNETEDDFQTDRYKQEHYEFVDEECNTDYMREGL